MNKSHAWLSQHYRFNATLNLWRRVEEPSPPGSTEDDTEEHFARIVRKSFDRSSLSLELLEADPAGPGAEDFSPRRANLLRPLRNLLRGTILEIGAGRGSLTRFLGECGADVVAVEKNTRRAAVAASRCAELSNVSVVAEDFAALPAGPQFDVVMLIGLFESSTHVGTGGLDPVTDLITRARSFLRPGGHLIIAVENQLGLKSLTGAVLEHPGEGTASIKNGSREDRPLTFGREELARRLADGGLPEQQWWFPLPDFRLPVAMISDQILRHEIDLSTLVAASVRADSQPLSPLAAVQESAWQPMLRNGLWPSLADALLVVSSDMALPEHDVLAVHFGAPRRPAFARELRFVWRDGTLLVERSRLVPENAATQSAWLSLRVANEPFETERSWQAELAALSARKGWTLEAWTRWARRWFDAVIDLAALPAEAIAKPQTPISGGLIDAIPRNMIVEGGGRARFFNQEWQLREPVELGFLVYRGLFASLDALIDCAEPAPGVSLSKMALFRHVVSSLDWRLTADDIRRYAEVEDRIQKEIGDVGARSLASLHDPLPVHIGMRALAVGGGYGLKQALADARAKSEQLAEALETSDKEHQASLRYFAQLEQDFFREKQAGREARQEIAAMAAVGERLVQQLRRAHSKPWNPARQALQRAALRLILLLKPLLSKRTVRRFQNSLQKRKPTRFQLEWEMARLQAPVVAGLDQAGDLDERDIALIEASGLFDASYYPATGKAHALGMSPVAHYVKFGEASGLPPSSTFDPDFYGSLYSDITERRLSHYILYGRNEGRSAVPFVHRMEFPRGTIDPERSTVILMVHEASRTGAPILGWNIVRALRRKYNVIAVIQRPGSLEDAFEREASLVINLPAGFLPYEPEYDQLARALIKHYQPEYVIANSVETRGIVPGFERQGVPVVALVHEFSSYYRPIGLLYALLEQASQVIFPAQVVADAALKDHGYLLPRRYTILPQGGSELPVDVSRADAGPPATDPRILKRPGLPEHGDIDALPARDGTLLVVGMGTITMRKGIDAFIAAAADVGRQRPDLKIKFAWAGEAFDFDQQYVDFIQAQVERSNLGDRFSFLGAFSDLEPLYARTDIMVLSSRLDPLPNVSIDCALRGIPVLCFENASGMAEILLKRADTKQLVVPYLDSGALADRLLDLATNPELRQSLSAAMREIGQSTFDMQSYVERLDGLAQTSLRGHRQAKFDFETIKASGIFNGPLYQTGAKRQLGDDEAIRHYLQASRNAAPRGEPHAGRFVRRPVEGFHPLVYASDNESYQEASGEDPLAHYLRSGMPSGRWQHKIIAPKDSAAQTATELKVAVHGHFHYPELLPEFLERMSLNRTPYDLLITTTSDERQTEIQRLLAASAVSGTVIVVPNKGRDIGPLLSAFPRDQIFSYDLIGHFHGKRSPHAAALGEVWRTFLWEHLVGGRFPMVDEIASAFEAEPKLGLVFAEDPYMWDWNDNRTIAEDIAKRLGIKLPNHFDFPIGTMFWARPAALAPLFDLELKWDDYPSEPVPIDGTLLHVLERMLPFAAEKAGFNYATTYLRDHRR